MHRLVITISFTICVKNTQTLRQMKMLPINILEICYSNILPSQPLNREHVWYKLFLTHFIPQGRRFT